MDSSRPPFSAPSSSNPFHSIKESLLKFKSFLLKTTSYDRHVQTERKNFPSKEAGLMLQKIYELNSTLSNLSGGRLNKLPKFTAAMRTIAASLHKREGILAFDTMMETMIDMTFDAEESERKNWALWNENMELRGRIDELELQIAEIEPLSSVDTPLVDVFGNLSFSRDIEPINESADQNDDEMTYLLAIEKAFIFCNQDNVFILDIYIAHVTSNVKARGLVIVFESSDNIEPPMLSFVVWRNVAFDVCSSSDQENENWLEFCLTQPEDHRQLLLNFADPVCTRLISEHDDCIAIMPFAYSVCNAHPFEPALQVVRKAVGYSSVHNNSDVISYDMHVQLSCGKRLRIIEKQGWFSPMMQTNSPGTTVAAPIATDLDCLFVGCGVCSAASDNEFGTVGGFAKGTDGSAYFITCEHVIESARSQQCKKIPPFAQDPNMHFKLPSTAVRKYKLISSVVALNQDQKLNANFLDALLTNYDHQRLKSLVGVEESEDVTLKDVATYLNRDQLNMDVVYDEIVKLSLRTVSLEYGDGVTIDVTGDMAAVKIPADTYTRINADAFKVNKKNVIRVATMAEMYKTWTSLVTKVDVYKAGVTDNGATVAGSILKPAHVKLPNKSKFLNERLSQTLMDLKGKPKLLLGQYLISSTADFGRGGDSGAMVYTNNHDGSAIIVGTFVGSFAGDREYIATPAEALTAAMAPFPTLAWDLHPQQTHPV